MSRPKILVTGGSGFIGRNIRESFLADKYSIYAPSKSALDCSNDESVRQYFARHSFDAVIHAAGKPGHRNATDTGDILYTNSRMFFNLASQQAAWGKLILIGSGAVYDMEHYRPKMSESYFGTHIPKDPHGYTRFLIGKALPTLQNVYDLRIFGIYGKYEDYAIRFISNAICKTLRGLPITLKQDRLFDYLYIDDLMPVLDYFLTASPAEKAVNITPDYSVSLLEIAQLVNKSAGNTSEIRVGKTGRGPEYSGSNRLLRTYLPNLVFTPLEEGIEKLRQWYLENPASIDHEKLIIDK